ncbi:hypothetical protein H4Q26_011003 [Puccinia striiformis f. sp. tritici PST-130]|nr:hypothetical protein H4Q26_011003 [Puccinia striiformis f. sp. tritici PST-130]
MIHVSVYGCDVERRGWGVNRVEYIEVDRGVLPDRLFAVRTPDCFKFQRTHPNLLIAIFIEAWHTSDSAVHQA